MSVTTTRADGRPAPRAAGRAEDPGGHPRAVLRGDRSCAGRVLDASLTGLLVELSEPLPFVEADVVVALVLPHAGRHDVDAEIVRRALAGRRQGAARPAPGRAGGRARSGRRGGRAGRAPSGWQKRERPRAVALAELRALGTRAYEMALVDPDASAPAPLVAWIGRLAAELEVEPPRRPTACRDLLTAVSDLSREARAGSEPGPAAVVVVGPRARRLGRRRRLLGELGRGHGPSTGRHRDVVTLFPGSDGR